MEPDDITPESPSSAEDNKRDLHQPTQPSVFGAHVRPFRRNGIRPQPSQILEKQAVEPPTSTMTQPTPQLRRKPTQKKSLFNLFSRAKADAQPNDLDQDVATTTSDTSLPPTPLLPAEYMSPKPDSSPNIRPTSAPREAPQRAPSAMSHHTNVSHTPFESKPPGPAISAHRDIAAWDPPPLFQAVAQSTIQALLECPNPNSISPPVKGRKSIAAQRLSADTRSRDSAEDARSIEIKAQNANEELPRKIFVLIGSGYLLQYAEIGPSERLPEKILQLGMESAAFASDRIPGRHHVIQVFQAVDANGASVTSSGSFFSRLGKRSATAKRTIPSILLLMPNGREMDAWILALRENIESMGGPKARPDTANTTTRPNTSDSLAAVTEVKEASPEKMQPIKEISPPSPVAASPNPPSSVKSASPRLSLTNTEDERAETNTIDDIDQLATDLDDRNSPEKAKEGLDFFSFTSTTTTTMDQNLKGSLHNSERESNGSAATLATTVGTPSTSLNGSPLFEELLSGAFRTPTDALSSQVGRRRSSSQLRSSREQSLPKLDVLAQVEEDPETKTARASGGDGFKPFLLPPMRSPMAAASSPDLRTLAEATSKHDSKMPMPPLPGRDSADKLNSIIANLPPLTTWPSDSSLDISMFPTPSSPQQRMSVQTSPRDQEAQREKRRSRAFNMPMKINPSVPSTLHPARVSSRNSHLFGEDELRSPVPVVHTLTAKGGEVEFDPAHRPLAVSMSLHNSAFPTRPVQRNTATRPLILNTSMPPPLPSPLLSSSPMLVGSNEASPMPSPAVTQGKPSGLKRPPSIRVSSNHAPFLQSFRAGVNDVPGQAPRVYTTPPIRPLRSSKSSPHMAGVSPDPSVGDFPLPSPLSRTPSTMRDGGLHLTPQMHRTPSPMLPSSGASTPRTPGRRSKANRGLPELDFGIPVVGLGPPAPPPSAPLPLPPQMGSRNASPMSTPMPSPGIGMANGLGIRI